MVQSAVRSAGKDEGKLIRLCIACRIDHNKTETACQRQKRSLNPIDRELDFQNVRNCPASAIRANGKNKTKAPELKSLISHYCYEILEMCGRCVFYFRPDKQFRRNA
jgi:hypothetical protein